MGDRPTLILTTRLGVRPLGVRGDALHNVAGQLLAVIRRRLGEGPANLLAEPQLREGGDGIDWYAARSGEVRRFADLSESERAATLETVETRLAAIRSLGAVLKESTSSEEARLIGRSLELATARPSDDFIFLVDGEPVIAAWGYEADAVAGLAAFAPPPVPVPARPAPAVLASAPAAVLPARLAWAPWLSALLFGLLLLLLLLITSWLLRACAPVDPSLNIATLETPAPPAPEPPPDPTPLLKASLDSEAGRPEQAQGRARRPRGRAQGQGGDVQADRAAQAATSSATTTGGQGAAAASAAATAGRRAAGAAGGAHQPAAAGPAALQLVGRFGRRGRHAQPTLSGG